MKFRHRLAALVFLGTMQALAIAADPAPPLPGLDTPERDIPPATTDTVPSPPYGGDATLSPGSAGTTNGSAAPGASSLPPGASPRDGALPGTPSEAAIPPIFIQLDTNKDGFVARDEARRSADTTARFDELDIDRDGRLSASEMKAGEAAVPGR